MSEELKPEELPRLGVISISSEALRGISPAITIDATTTQRELRDQGVLQTLHDYLLLPESYTIKALFYGRRDWRTWELLVESPELPEVPLDQAELPEVQPRYALVDGEAHLVDLKIIEQRHIPVSGGIDWLVKASLKQALPDAQIEKRT